MLLANEEYNIQKRSPFYVNEAYYSTKALSFLLLLMFLANASQKGDCLIVESAFSVKKK